MVESLTILTFCYPASDRARREDSIQCGLVSRGRNYPIFGSFQSFGAFNDRRVIVSHCKFLQILDERPTGLDPPSPPTIGWKISELAKIQEESAWIRVNSVPNWFERCKSDSKSMKIIEKPARIGIFKRLGWGDPPPLPPSGP